MNNLTRILSAVEQGDPKPTGRLLPLVYDDLRQAARRLAREKPGQTLEATALVGEAYLRLVRPEKSRNRDDRGHFFAAVEAMSASSSTMSAAWIKGSSGTCSMLRTCRFRVQDFPENQ
jgi:hypothetical protein